MSFYSVYSGNAPAKADRDGPIYTIKRFRGENRPKGAKKISLHKKDPRLREDDEKCRGAQTPIFCSKQTAISLIFQKLGIKPNVFRAFNPQFHGFVI